MLSEIVHASSSCHEPVILGPVVMHMDDPNRIYCAGGTWNRKEAKFDHGNFGQSVNELHLMNPFPTQFISGCAIFVPTSILLHIGKFDPAFFLTWEDCDFCKRATKAGYGLLVVPTAKVFHEGSINFIGGKEGLQYRYYYHRNRLLWMRKHLSALAISSTYVRVILPNILSAFCRVCSRIRLDEQYTLKKIIGLFNLELSSYLDFFRGRLSQGRTFA